MGSVRQHRRFILFISNLIRLVGQYSSLATFISNLIVLGGLLARLGSQEVSIVTRGLGSIVLVLKENQNTNKM